MSKSHRNIFIETDQEKFKKLKKLSAEEGTTMKQLVNDGIDMVLNIRSTILSSTNIPITESSVQTKFKNFKNNTKILSEKKNES